MSVLEVRSVLAHLDEVLAAEGGLVITRHGGPNALPLPSARAADIPQHADFRKTMPRLTVGSEVDVRADRGGGIGPRWRGRSWGIGRGRL